MPAIEWIRYGQEQPPIQERLLLIVSAAGEPPDALLMGKSEIFVGYWTGEYFRPLVPEYPLGTDLKVSYWAKLHGLPANITLQSRPEFKPGAQ
jgi:hypothetical protein